MMDYFYQLEIPSLGLIGAPVRTKDLRPRLEFAWAETPVYRPYEEEPPEYLEVRRLVFELRDRYHLPGGLCGIYRLNNIVKLKRDNVEKIPRAGE